MFTAIESMKQFEEMRKQQEDFYVVAFLGDYSDASRRAEKQLSHFADEHEDVPLFAVDVEKVKGAHEEFGVERVPTVLAVEDGEVTKSAEGAQSARFYGLHFAGANPHTARETDESRPRRVVVYTSPGCPACSQIKNYLRRNGISYRDIDVSRDQRAAEKLVRRSGQMAVPQTDIDGELVVGFDQSKLNRLLGITEEK